jgi:hypothetical protein
MATSGISALNVLAAPPEAVGSVRPCVPPAPVPGVPGVTVASSGRNLTVSGAARNATVWTPPSAPLQEVLISTSTPSTRPRKLAAVAPVKLVPVYPTLNVLLSNIFEIAVTVAPRKAVEPVMRMVVWAWAAAAKARAKRPAVK